MTRAVRRIGAVAAIAVTAAARAGLGQTTPLPAVQLTPDQLTWGPYPAGGQQAVLVGDPSRYGTYAVRLRLPAGLRLPPHFHPDPRVVTVLSGTMYFGLGDVFDSTRVRAFPSGSVWTEPAGLHHFAWARDGDVVLQVVGSGPSGMTLIPQDTAFTAMQARGRAAMGVDQYSSSHVFEPLPDGGRIVLQRDLPDSAGTAAIRAHMDSVPVAFSRGDFRVPGFVHAQAVPGTAVMAARRAVIRYSVDTLPRGAQVRIMTTDPEAIRAVHEFLEFQRTAHHSAAHESPH